MTDVESPPRWWRRRFVRWPLRLVAGVVLLVVAVLLLLQVPPVRLWVVEQAVEATNQAVAGDLSVESLEGNLVTSIGLVGVTLRDAAGAEVARVDSIAVELDLLALLSRRLSLPSVKARGLSGVVLDASGEVAILAALEPVDPPPEETEPPGEPWEVDIGVLQIEDLVVHEREDGGRRVALSLEAALEMRPGREWLYVSDLMVTEGAANTLRLAGTVDDFGAPRLHLTLSQLAADLATLGVPGLRGDLRGSAAVSGAVSDAALRVDLTTTGGTIGLLGTAGFDAAGPHWALALDAAALRPTAFLAAVQPDLGFDLHVETRGAGDPTAEGEATLAVQLLGLEGLDGPPLPLSLDARLERGALVAHVSGADSAGGVLEVHAASPSLALGSLDVDTVIIGADIARWVAFLDEPDLGGVVDELRATAHIDRLDDGVIAADASWRLRARGLALPEGLGGPAGAITLETSGTLQHTGFGLPTGTIALSAEGADASMVGVGASAFTVGVDLLEARSGRRRAVGALEVDGLTSLDASRLGSLRLPFDLVLDPSGLPRTGSASLVARAIGHHKHGVRMATADLALDTAAGTTRLTGPVAVEGVVIGGGTSLPRATVEVDARRSLLGAVEATLGIDIAAVQSTAGLSVGGTTGTLEVTVPSADPSRPTVEGVLTVRRVKTPSVSLETVVATVDAGLAAGAPVGRVRLDGRKIRVGRGRVKRLAVVAALGADGMSSLKVDTGGGDLEVAVDLAIDGVLDGTQTLATRVKAGRVVRRGLGFELAPGGRITFDPMTGVVEGKDVILGLIGPRRSELSAAARFDPRTGRLRARLITKALPVATWIDTARKLGLDMIDLGPVGGRLSLDVDLDGTLRRPSAKVSARLASGRLGDLEELGFVMEGSITESATALAVDMEWAGGRHVQLSLALPERVGVTRWRPDANTALALDLTARKLDVHQLRRWLPQVGGEDLRGVFDGAMKFEGTLGLPTGAAHWTVTGLGTGSPSDADGALDLQVGGDGVRGQATVATRGRERLKIAVGMPRSVIESALLGGAGGLGSQPVTLQLSLSPTRVGDLPFTSGLGDVRRMKAQSELEISGTVAAPSVLGGVSIRDIPIQTTTANASFDLATHQGILRGALSLTSRGRELLDGILAVPVDAALAGPDTLLLDKRLRVGLSSHLPVSVLSELNPGLGRFLADAVDSSNIDFTAAVGGGLPGERRVGAQLVLQSPRPEQELLDLGLAASVRLSAEVREETTQLNFLAEQGPHGGHLYLHAELDDGLAALLAGELGPATELAGAMSSKGFRLEGLQRAMPRVFGPTEGELVATASLDGTLGDPIADGRLAFEFSEVHLIPLGLIQRDLALGMAFDRSEIRMDPPLNITKRGGSLDFDFSVDTSTLGPETMAIGGRLELSSFQLLERRDAEMTLSGEMTFAGTVAEPEIRGRLEVDEGKLAPAFGGRDVQRIGLPADVTFVSSEETVSEALLGDETEEIVVGTNAAGAIIDLVVEIPPRNIRIKNELADIQLQGDISVRTQDSLISVKGLISVLAGKVQIAGLEWILDSQSKIVLTGSPVIDPVLNIRAETDISEVDLSAVDMEADRDSRIYVEVTGTATRPELRLSSNLGLEQTHILSILAVGKPMGDIGATDSDSNSGGGPNYTEVLLSTVVGVAMGSISTLVTDNLPVDVFELEAGGDFGLAEAAVRVGKRITRDWLVLYTYDAGANADDSDGPRVNEHELTSEYAITPWLLWEVGAGDAGQGATELLFRWRF